MWSTCSSEWARHLGKEEIYKTVEPRNTDYKSQMQKEYTYRGESFMIKSSVR